VTQPLLLTYYDCIQAAVDFLSGHSTVASQRDVRRVIHEAYREVGEVFGWSFLQKQSRVQLRETYDTGSVAYNSTSRVLTMTTGSWPSWAADATVRIDSVPSQVQTRTNSTSLVLHRTMNPGKAIASGTSFQLYPTSYTLPEDFLNMVKPWGEDSWWNAKQVSYDEMLSLDRYYEGPGSPRRFCVREIADLHGSFGLYIHPASDTAETVDFIYRRRGRQLRYSGHDSAETVGTITVTGGGVVTGTDTQFSSRMEGSVMRIGLDDDNTPTGLDGLFPYSDERIIDTVDSTTSLTLDGATTAQASAVNYVITDPIDIDISLANAMLACIRKRLAVQRNFKNKGEYIGSYEEELWRARQNDQRVRQPRVMGGGTRWVRRYSDTTIGNDLT